MSIKVQFITRIRIVILAMLVFCMAILYKVVDIQYINNDKWIAKAEKAHIRVRSIKATRGNIYAEDGSLLATSLPFYTVAFDPSVSTINQEREGIFNEGIDSLSIYLSRFYNDYSRGYYKDKIIKARDAKRKYVRINKKQINYAEKKEMEKWPIFKRGQMKGGVIFEKVERRFTPFGGLAARSIGRTKEDSARTIKGMYGLEYSFNDELSGVNGRQLFAKIGGGVWKPVTEKFITKPEQGRDLETTIDVNIQDFAETAITNAVREHDAGHGCAIVMEVATGEIKALVNIDQVIRNDNKSYREIYNWAVGRKSEPGSTMKLASVMALLEERSDINLDTKVETGNGKFKFFDVEMRDSKVGGHGEITLREAFKVSSNIGIAKLVNETFYHKKQTQKRFIDYLSKFGLAKPLDFQLKGSAEPNIKTPDDESWSGISLPWMSIGYEAEMSPLQMLSLYNTVANDGYFVQPRLVKGITEDGELVEEYKVDKSTRRICSAKTIKSVKEMLWAVVNEKGGTAYAQRSNQYSLSGKTGTKQLLKNSKYVHEYYATFAGFFPSEKPKYSILIAIDHPKNGKFYGSQVAAPVFKDIADKIYKNDLELHPHLDPNFKTEKGKFPVVRTGYYNDLKLLCDELHLNYWGGAGELWVTAYRDDELKQIKWRDVVIKEETVPKVIGMTLRDAISLLENLGLKVEMQGRGRVVSQSQDAESKLIFGSVIKLKLQ